MPQKQLRRILLYVSPFHAHGIPLDLAVGAVDKLAGIAGALATEGVQVEVFTSDRAARKMREQRSDVFAKCRRVHALPTSFFLDVGAGSYTQAAAVFDGTMAPASSVPDMREMLKDHGLTDNYDIVLSFFSETQFLKALFPTAKVLFFETGLVCHLPFRQFHSFDPFGSFADGSYIGRKTADDLSAQADALAGYMPILEGIRNMISAFSARYYSGLSDLHGLRAKWEKIYLVVAQPMGRSADKAQFPSAFELVEHIAATVPAGSALLLSEHPNFPQLTAAQHQYLQETYPNVIYSSALQSLYSPSVLCLPIVDAVIGISSTVLLNAHVIGLPTHSLGTSSYAKLNAAKDLSAFVSSVEHGVPPPSRDLQILDLIARYSVPLALYTTPWLKTYLDNVLNASDGELPLIAPPETLLAHYEPRPLPDRISKPERYLQTHWRSAPLSLAEPAIMEPPAPARTMVSKRRTVATVLDHFAIGGTQQVVRRLINMMPDTHWVIFVERRVDNEFPLAENCEVIEIGAIGDQVPDADRKLAQAVFAYHKANPIDVFVNPMHWRPAALTAIPLIKKIVGIPVVYWEHNSFFFPMYLARPELHALRAEVAEVADRVVLLSDYDRWHFATHYPKSRHQVILNPVPTLATEGGIVTKEKKVLIVGRFDPQKRMDRIVDVAVPFLRAHPDWSISVLGDGYLRQGIEAELNKTAIADRVQFLGHLDDPTPHFRKSAIFASLSDFEGDPLTFVEAKAHQLPIVAFELFQNTKLRDGVDGFQVPQGDTAGFVQKLSLLASDPAVRRQMGKAGQDHFRSFNNTDVAAQWSDLFDAVVVDAPFDPAPLTPPRAEILQREAIHVTACLHRAMQPRLDKSQKAAATVPKPMPAPAPAPAQTPRKTVEAARTVARNHMRRGSYGEAIAAYEKCVSLMPQNANLRRLFAEALFAQGERANAIGQLSVAHKLKPENRSLRRRMQKMMHPTLYFWRPHRPFVG
ncbi:MAG: glycosyltransferase [Pseudomonadota bacterium]